MRNRYLKLNEIINGDCREIFPQIQRDHPNLVVITDPPYNINFSKYHDYDDNLPDQDYIDLLSTFRGVDAAVIQYPEEMMKYVVPAMGVPLEVLSWCYNSNLPRKFRLINIYGRKPVFRNVLQPYKNPKDTRIQKRIAAGSKGTPIYDWFNDIQIVKNTSKEKTAHPCPLPEKLIERVILLMTTPKDIVVDPFMGSATTAIACLKTGRKFIGIEKSKKYCQLAERRIHDYLDQAI